MNLYKFHTFRTNYYFPKPVKGGDFLFGLYHPYNKFPLRLLAIRIYWWLYKHCDVIRRRTLVTDPDSVFPYSQIMQMCPKGSILSFNMGTPGPEQKISILGLEQDGKHFFAKYSINEDAMALSRNEIKVLSALNGKGIAPELYDYKDGGNFVFFRTSCVDGDNPKDVMMNDAVLMMAITISKTNGTGISDKGLITCFSHGDFTPWNMIVSPNGHYQMIDWELTLDAELGYDIFTYVTHVGALLSPNKTTLQLINENQDYVKRYFDAFDISNWTPYLKAFAKRRIEYDKSKGELEHAKQFECLL